MQVLNADSLKTATKLHIFALGETIICLEHRLKIGEKENSNDVLLPVGWRETGLEEVARLDL